MSSASIGLGWSSRTAAALWEREGSVLMPRNTPQPAVMPTARGSMVRPYWSRRDRRPGLGSSLDIIVARPIAGYGPPIASRESAFARSARDAPKGPPSGTTSLLQQSCLGYARLVAKLHKDILAAGARFGPSLGAPWVADSRRVRRPSIASGGRDCFRGRYGRSGSARSQVKEATDRRCECADVDAE